MSDSAKNIANINTSGSTGWVAPEPPWAKTLRGLKKRTAYSPKIYEIPKGTYDPNRPVQNLVTGEYAKPNIPKTIDTTTTGTNDSVKTATTAVFTDIYFSALPDYEMEETLSLKSLTGNEILQIAHRENFYTTGEVLNRNILDIVESRNFYAPSEIIKLQTPDYSYFQNSLASYTVSLASSTVSVSIPSYKIATSYKIQVETFAPREIKNDTIY